MASHDKDPLVCEENVLVLKIYQLDIDVEEKKMTWFEMVKNESSTEAHKHDEQAMNKDVVLKHLNILR